SILSFCEANDHLPNYTKSTASSSGLLFPLTGNHLGHRAYLFIESLRRTIEYFAVSPVKRTLGLSPIANVPSILEHGILSHRLADRVEHESVAMPEIQMRRRTKQVPGGRPLHDYVNLYFNVQN